jgi:two-component system NtrC family sensor kinase
MASQLAVGLENAYLHQELQARFDALQKVQARLVQNEKLAAIGQLVAEVVHELNSPLTAILGLTHLLQDSGPGPEISRDLEKMAAHAQRARRIVRDLLDFAHQSPLNRKPTQINEILSAILDLLAQALRAYHVSWRTDLAVDLPLTMADPHQLQQVFINLITNAGQAIKDARGGGHLTISSELVPSIFYPHTAQATPVIRIIIVDDGPGISPDVLPHIFEPFFTTKPAGEGTGLGLAVCRGIISAHDGHIWAESEPGQGTSFFIELPVAGIKDL